MERQDTPLEGRIRYWERQGHSLRIIGALMILCGLILTYLAAMFQLVADNVILYIPAVTLTAAGAGMFFFSIEIIGELIDTLKYQAMHGQRQCNRPGSSDRELGTSYCRYCGRAIPTDSAFCERCGKEL